jgi:hypothetical protein
MRNFIKFSENDNYSIFTFESLSVLFPNTVFPSSFEGDEKLKIYTLIDEPPENNNILKKLVQVGPQKRSDSNVYEMKYEIVDLDFAEKQKLTFQKWNEIRSQRTHFLNSTDWVVTKHLEKNQPLPEKWINYRQQLRDITNQTDPFEIVWPEMPTD